MELLTGIILTILALVVLLQIGRIADFSKDFIGKDESERTNSDTQGWWLMIFMVVSLILFIWVNYYYKNYLMGYGPNIPASEHGHLNDEAFNLTTIFTTGIFFVTQILLFWYAFRYRYKKGAKVSFFVHSTKLEMFWTIIPTLVLTYLIIQGLSSWSAIMRNVEPGEEYIEIEATGYQFAWDLRYPGNDGQLGDKNYTLIDPASNPVGQDWNDTRNIDDFYADELILPKGRTIKIRITSKDVLHNFYLPHFRLKMDAVPGTPTYFVFTPSMTTEEYRHHLSSSKEWQIPSDPEDPNSPQKWQVFDYELACAELCGSGHYSMRKIVKVITAEEWDKWATEKEPYYLKNIRNTDDDPFKGQLLDIEINNRAEEIETLFNKAMTSTTKADKVFVLKNVWYNTGSANLSELSKHELGNLVGHLKLNKEVMVELGGYSDNVGDASMNKKLSYERSSSVLNYLKNHGISEDRLNAVGYGDASPIESNETATGRKLNRRTEFRLL